MRKIIFFIISFLFIFNSIASACNFRISNFGDPKEKVKIEPLPPLLMPDQFGGESLIIPIEDLCKTDQSLLMTCELLVERVEVEDGKMQTHLKVGSVLKRSPIAT